MLEIFAGLLLQCQSVEFINYLDGKIDCRKLSHSKSASCSANFNYKYYGYTEKLPAFKLVNSDQQLSGENSKNESFTIKEILENKNNSLKLKIEVSQLGTQLMRCYIKEKLEIKSKRPK